MRRELGSYRFGPFRLDPARRRLEKAGREVPLQPKVFATLLYLVERSDRAVPREELLDALWPDEFVTDNVLSRCIREIRRALEDDARAPEYIRTVPRVGYHFVGEVGGPAAGPEPPRAVRTVAVLPFRSLVVGAGDESLEVGLADTLIARLSNLPGLVVRPLSAVRSYAGPDRDPIAAGEEQQAEAVVDGGLQQRGARLRVSVRVLRVADGSALLAETFDEPLTEIFGVQDAICRRIVEAFALRLTGGEARRLEKRPTESVDAYRLYLLGRLHLGRRTRHGAETSLEYFTRAIEEDPGYALAHVGLADAYDSLGTLGRATSERFDRARRAAERALQLDPELGQAFCVLGKVAWEYDWDWEAAEGFFRRAIELAPNDAEVWIAHSDFCAYLGRSEEAVGHARRALELDPVSPWVNALLAQALHMGGRHEEAIAQAERALEIAPGLAFAYLFRGLAALELGRPSEAVEHLERARESSDRLDFAGALGYARARAGDEKGARRLLAELTHASEGAPPLAFAMVHMGLGEVDRAFEHLEAAVAQRSWHVLLLHAEPVFSRLRSDPRAEELLRRIGLR